MTAPGEESVNAAARPLVSMLLIAYRQREFVAEAIRGALAQTYTPLEILVSDDASGDGTYEAAEAALRGYAGPHRVELLRNAENLGIGAHLSRLVQRSRGELLFVAAGDDISLPTRCEAVVAAWLAQGRKPDLIATDLLDLDHAGTQTHGLIQPDDLALCRGFDDWARGYPYVVGAAHTWTRRLFERFGGMPPQMSSEDLIMVFRAVMSGGAISLRQPLVQYRRGGLSSGARRRNPAEFVARLLRSNRSALAETAQLLQDAAVAGVLPQMQGVLRKRQARELYIRDIFAAAGTPPKLKLLFGRGAADPAFRLRMFLYAACPWVYAPFYGIRRWLSQIAG
jgi:glycosyltransferase involved in cell wall biosynthesis